jgi:hypothetical protein
MKHISILLIACSLLLSGCLGIPEDFEYEPSNCNNIIEMNVWDFMQSRPDAFSELIDVIRTSGADSTLYYANVQSYTYLLLNNSAIAGLKTAIGDVDDSNKNQWINALMYHTIDGYYHALGTLSFDPAYVVTLWRSQDAVMTLQMESRNSFSYSRLIVNGLDPAWDSLTNAYRYAVTSNLMCTNGVCHVLNRHARPISNNTFK